MVRETVSLGNYRGRIGEEIGVSRWFELDQARIDRFADVTEDWQYIHIDRDAAPNSPFGGTIAHGYLTLSLLTAMADDAMPRIDGIAMALNYGMNNVRFLAPVRSGARVRGRFKLIDVAARGPGAWRSTLGASVEIEGEIKLALVAEWLTLAFAAPS